MGLTPKGPGGPIGNFEEGHRVDIDVKMSEVKYKRLAM